MTAANWFVGLPVDSGRWFAKLVADAPSILRVLHPEDLHITVAFLGPISEDGTAEMSGLIQGGGDEAFIDYLARPDHTDNEATVFRELMFGATTEQLARIEAQMVAEGKHAIAADEVVDSDRLRDACSIDGDPAPAMFEFFLSRHLQASARRQADLPGPKRTAEEYVMLHFLEQTSDAAVLSSPSSRD